MSEETELFHDPANYRKLSEPFPDADAANAAIAAFMTELRELRVKHHIRDVVLVIGGSCLTADGKDESEFVLDSHHGDEFKVEPMLAFALGHAQEVRQERIGRYMVAKTIKKLPRGK